MKSRQNRDERAKHGHEYAEGSLGRNEIPSRSQKALLSGEISKEMLMSGLDGRKNE
ncbi:MAG: hypothetical protein HYT73_03470 [Candidatus Aenigmarchaeota archaeon]|nr:hypothetical protein [Candidatus Aenigmarchaeota archaeon]